MKTIYRQKNNYSAFKLTVILLFVYSLSFSQTDSCAFFGNKPIFPYYRFEPNNNKDFYAVKKGFKEAITAKTNFSGIITINFFINYKGETDFYNTQLCDENYKPSLITKDVAELCSQVLLAVKQTGPWKPALDDNKEAVNTRKFYSFRFNKGTLIEILPK